MSSTSLCMDSLMVYFYYEIYHRWCRTARDSEGPARAPRAQGGEALEIRERDGMIEIEPAATPMRLEDRGGASVAVPEDDLPPLTDQLVRATLERTRR